MSISQARFISGISLFRCPEDASPRHLGVLPGEGIGPEVVGVAMRVLELLRELWGLPIEVSFGGAIGIEADQGNGITLTEAVADFCRSIFSWGGAIFAGSGGGRFVYDSRRRFGLFCKLNPIRTLAGLSPTRVVDLLVVRENLGGLYQCRESFTEEALDCTFSTGFFRHREDRLGGRPSWALKRWVSFCSMPYEVPTHRRCLTK